MTSGSEQLAPMAIQLLGGFRVRVGERIVDEVEWGRRKPKAVVKMLALASGHRLHRDQLIDALWPELDPPLAASNLRKAVHRARAELSGGLDQGSASIISQGELLSLPPGTWVDVDAFERAASEARATTDIDAYRRAIALCRGELLPEDRYEEWVIRRHAELQADALAMLVELAALVEARCELVEAAGLLRRAVAMDAVHEEAAHGLMRVLAASGQRSEALSVYETLREALATEIGVDPGIETVELYEEIYSRTEGTQGHTAKRWERIGDLRMMAGDGTGALSALCSALVSNDSDAERSRLERKSAQAVLLTPTPGPAGEHLDAAESFLARWPDDSERVRVLATRANWLCQTGAPDAAVVEAEACRGLAERLGGADDLAAAYETIAIVCHYRGAWREGLLLEIDRLGTSADDAQLARVFDIHHCIGQYHLYSDDLSSGVEDYARHVLEVAGRQSARRAEAFAWCLLGEALMLRNRLNEAEACLTRSTDIHTELGSRSGGLPWQRLAEVAASRGDFDRAHDAATRGMAIATTSPMARHLWGRLYATLAYLELERGDPEAAVLAIKNAEAAAARYGDCPTCSGLLHPMAAEAYASCGNAEAAARHARTAINTAEAFKGSAWSAMAASAMSDASRAAGDVGAARRQLEEAAVLYERASHELWAGRARRRLVALDAP